MKNFDSVIELLDTAGDTFRNLIFRITLCESETDDLMQELFLRLADSRGFDNSRNRFAYAWQTAVNLALNVRKKNKNRIANLMKTNPVIERENTSPLNEIIQNENAEIIFTEVLNLKPIRRDIITLHFVQGLSYQEIATIFNKDSKYIRSQASKAVAHLRNKLGNKLQFKSLNKIYIQPQPRVPRLSAAKGGKK